MRKLTYLFVGVLLVTSCSARKMAANTGKRPADAGNIISASDRSARDNNESVRKANTAYSSTYTPLTSAQYIEKYKAVAIQEMQVYGIPASITLAQGLFESGIGNGELARVANNHFGIKASPTWTGRVYYKDDDNHNEGFRVYNSAEDSFKDHAIFLQKKNYIHLFELDKNDYKGWAYGLKKAGYATNPRYPELLIGVIEKYHLDQYDYPEGSELAKVKRVEKVFTQIDKKETRVIPDSVPAAATPAPVFTVKNYTVKQGDTLYNISKRFGLSVDDLMQLNNMTDNNIKIGQKIVVTR